jgi:hypothetical protein
VPTQNCAITGKTGKTQSGPEVPLPFVHLSLPCEPIKCRSACRVTKITPSNHRFVVSEIEHQCHLHDAIRDPQGFTLVSASVVTRENAVRRASEIRVHTYDVTIVRHTSSCQWLASTPNRKASEGKLRFPSRRCASDEPPETSILYPALPARTATVHQGCGGDCGRVASRGVVGKYPRPVRVSRVEGNP